MAQLNHGRANYLANLLADVDGVEVLNEVFFNEFTIRLSRTAVAVVDDLVRRGIMAGVLVSRLYPGDTAMENLLLVAVTETNSDDDFLALINGLREVL